MTQAKQTPHLDCGQCSSSLSLSLNRNVALDDAAGMAKLSGLLEVVARATGWYDAIDRWLCNDCAPSAVERLGELARDRP